MRFKVDENLPVEVADLLRDLNHDAATVIDQGLMGEPDADIAHICQKEQRAIITLDLDFADIRSYPPKEYPGLIDLRLKQHDKLYVLNIFGRVLQEITTEPLSGHLWIVEENRIRIRD